MRRRARAEEAEAPPDRLLRFRLPEWYAPHLDGPAPAYWPGHQVGLWHGVQAVKRYLAAKRAAGMSRWPPAR